MYTKFGVLTLDRIINLYKNTDMYSEGKTDKTKVILNNSNTMCMAYLFHPTLIDFQSFLNSCLVL